MIKYFILSRIRSSHPEGFIRTGVVKICSKYTGEHPCQMVISIELQSNFIEMTFRHGCSSVNFLHIFRTLFARNTCGWLLLLYCGCTNLVHYIFFCMSYGSRSNTAKSLCTYHMIFYMCFSLSIKKLREE